jgi:hypothetical protein
MISRATRSPAAADGADNAAAASRAPGKRALGVAIPLVVFALPFALYLRTLCPTIYPGDGGELAAAAWCLGVPHPTGYPLFTMLGFCFQHLGLGSPAFSMNLMCALFGALACVGAYRFNREIYRRVAGRRRARQAPWRFAAAAAALAMGASATWWDQSNQTEVYSLLLVFVSFAWAMGLRLVRRPTTKGLWGLAALSGIAFLHHQLFLVTLPLTAAGVLAWWRTARPAETPGPGGTSHGRPGATDPRPQTHLRGGAAVPEDEMKRVLLVALLLFVLPLFGYLYLPIRAAASPAVNWGNPRGVGGIVWHLTGRQYAGTRILTRPNGQKMRPSEVAAHVRSRAAGIVRWIGEQYIPPALEEEEPRPANRARAPLLGLIALLSALLGFASLWRHSRSAAAGLGLGVLANLAVVLLYTIADIHPYQVPLWLVVGSLAVMGPVMARDLFAQHYGSHPPSDSHRRLRAWVAGGVVLGLAVCGVAGYRRPARGVNKSEATGAYAYGKALMEYLPENAVVFTSGDYDIYPLWYAQICEGRRPDVAVVGANFVLNRWYAATLRASLPEGVEVFIGDEPPSDMARWLVAFLGGMVAPQIEAGRPVYMTLFPGDPALTAIGAKYRLKPVLEFSGAQPNPALPPLVLFEVTDPDGFSPRAREVFRQEFPDHVLRMVKRQGSKG